jgi:hypothetical protein
MNIKFRAIAYAVMAAGFLLTANSACSSNADPFPGLVLPIYQGAYGIETGFSRLKGTKSIIYRVQTHFPAAEVLEFYDAALNGSGWKPSFETCQRHWAIQDGGSIRKEFQARQLFTSWEHPQYRLQIALLLEYQPAGAKRPDEVVVQCRLQPQLDNSRHERFIGRLKASGQYHAFTQKLDAYRKSDGELDSARIARDIQNNKADENLIGYKRIMDEERREIENIIRLVNEAR